MRRAVTLLVMATAVTGCGGEEQPDPPPQARLGCSDPLVTDLGVPSQRVPAYFTVSSGRVRLEVSDLLTGTVLGDISKTAVYVGDAAMPPRPDPAHPERVADAAHRVVVGLEAPATIDLTEGRYWLVSANSGRIRMGTCPEVEVSEVQAAQPDPGKTFGSRDEGT